MSVSSASTHTSTASPRSSGQPASASAVDVVICTKDRPDRLAGCLRSVAGQALPPARVIVVDGGDGDPVEADGAQVLRSPPGLTRQRNLGLSRCQSELVAFLDDDVEIEGDYLETVAHWFSEHPKCVGAGGNIVSDPVRRPISRLFRRLFSLADADGLLRRSGEANYLRHPSRPERVDVISGSNMVFRRSLISGLIFDEAFEGYGYMEDVDFCLQAGERGEMWALPEARLVHHEAPEARIPRRDFVRQVLANGARVFTKHRERRQLSPFAFSRRVVGRAIAYLGIAVRHASLEPTRGVVAGLRELPSALGAQPLAPAARLGLLGVLLTPLALIWDYRIGSGVISDTIAYVPYAENGGFLATYEQVFGATQVLWLLLAAWALAHRDRRAGFRTLTVAALTGLLALVLGVTVVTDGLDRYAILALSSTLFTLIAISGVLLHPAIGLTGVRRIAFAFLATTALVCGATLASDLVRGGLSERFDLVLFGAPTDTGLVLATSLLLVPALRAGRAVSAALGLVLMAGLILSGTRGALVALAVGAAVLVLMLPHRRRGTVIAVGAVFAVVVAAFALLRERSFILTDDATSLRQAELERHWQLLLDRPSFGYGLAAEAAPFSTAAHNTLLGIANAAGIGGALLWLVAWLTPAVRAVSRRATLEQAAAVAVIAATFAGWFTTGSEVLLYTAPTNLLPLVIAAALAGIAALKEPA